MDVDLFEASESKVKARATLLQYFKQIENIKRKLRNPRIPGKKKRDLKRKEKEVQDKINDLNSKLYT